MDEFKVGDIVEAFGATGTIIGIYHDNEIAVHFEEVGVETSFCIDGRIDPYWPEPSLKLIERPKKKVKKWVNVFLHPGMHSTFTGRMHKTIEEADETSTLDCSADRIACVEIEVPEDEV